MKTARLLIILGISTIAFSIILINDVRTPPEFSEANISKECLETMSQMSRYAAGQQLQIYLANGVSIFAGLIMLLGGIDTIFELRKINRRSTFSHTETRVRGPVD